MRNLNKILRAVLCATSLGLTSLVHADESFVQDGKQYVLKSDVVGIIHKSDGSKMNEKRSSIMPQKRSAFFDVYDAEKIQDDPNLTKNKKLYRVVYRQSLDPRTKKTIESPAILTGDVIVQAKDVSKVQTGLKLKVSYPKNGFHIYELPELKSIDEVLTELSNLQNVTKARVEIIEHLRKPM